jgi:DNA invertase Pin-like site-specific DNA recombinase
LKTPRDKYKKKMQNKRFSTILSSTIRLEKVVNLTYTELVVKLVSTSQVGDVDAVVKITFVRNTTIGGKIMSKEYGYARISTPKQNIDRQVRNILAAHPQAHMIKEVFTGTKFQGRKELDKLLRTVKPGDTIIFDSVSRMSRNAEEGFLLYQDLFNQGINLVFLKEPHINTDTYKRALQGGIPTTGTNVDFILDGVNKYLLALAKEQIRLAFEQAEKEVQDLHQRTAEGIETARLAGKQIGQKPGTHLVTKKSVAAKEIILKHNKAFGGSLNDIETIRQAGITRKTFYKYKKELLSNTVA